MPGAIQDAARRGGIPDRDLALMESWYINVLHPLDDPDLHAQWHGRFKRVKEERFMEKMLSGPWRDPTRALRWFPEEDWDDPYVDHEFVSGPETRLPVFGSLDRFFGDRLFLGFGPVCLIRWTAGGVAHHGSFVVTVLWCSQEQNSEGVSGRQQHSRTRASYLCFLCTKLALFVLVIPFAHPSLSILFASVDQRALRTRAE